METSGKVLRIMFSHGPTAQKLDSSMALVTQRVHEATLYILGPQNRFLGTPLGLISVQDVPTRTLWVSFCSLGFCMKDRSEFSV